MHDKLAGCKVGTEGMFCWRAYRNGALRGFFRWRVGWLCTHIRDSREYKWNIEIFECAIAKV